jgi:hypothetical protein
VLTWFAVALVGARWAGPCDGCRHLAAYARSDKRRPSRDQVVAVHVLTHR